ncbi:hypothetical protein AAES_70013 [Amazona aestiva]|uniref:Uncharacterized protein n=1 Tax=Amazona aestiva TaxID=12930 RepID=A0A0Q3MJ79_AMAAE|nr:hypothetical protein AAES_70013 [Amazona aestiva]
MVGPGPGGGAPLENANPLIYRRSGERPVNDAESTVTVEFTPTIPHCSMATLIGLSIKVKLIRSLPERFKLDVHITPGTHVSEHAETRDDVFIQHLTAPAASKAWKESPRSQKLAWISVILFAGFSIVIQGTKGINAYAVPAISHQFFTCI